MLACLLLTVAAISSPPAQLSPGWTKGEKLGEAVLSAENKVASTGVAFNPKQNYYLEITGTMTSTRGDQYDGNFQFSPGASDGSGPYISMSIMYVRADGGTTYISSDLRGKYQPNHVYGSSSFLGTVEMPDLKFTLADAKAWDGNNNVTDKLETGSLKITVYQYLPPGEKPPAKPVEKPANLSFSLLDPFQFFDPNSATSMTFPLVDAPILGNYAKMGNAEPTYDIKGAACDGASLVLLRSVSNEAAEVTFKLEPGDGALYPLVGNPYTSEGTDKLAVHTIADPSDPAKKKFFGFALYRPPSNWANLGSPKVNLAAEFENGSGRSVKTLRLVRPPVVLVHGTFDSPKGCYNTRDDADDSPMTMTQRLNAAGFDHVSSVDWESTNGSADPSTFRDNQYVVSKNKGGIKEALAQMRSEGYVSVQADLVCHSQGGVVARVFARGFPLDVPMGANHPHFHDPVACMALGCKYHNAESFGAGSIHRLVTISTTHMGSDICRLFTLFSEYSAQASGFQVPNGAWLDLFRTGGYLRGSGIFTGGFRDQIPGSDGLKGIGPTPVPSHAIAGVSLDEDVLTQYKGFYRDRMEMIYNVSPDDAIEWSFRKAGQDQNADELLALSKKVRSVRLPLDRNPLLLAFRRAVFGNEENDCTVRISSSFGGLGEKYRTRVPGVLHGWEPRYVSIQNRVVQVLRDDSLVDPNGFPDAYSGARCSVTITPSSWSAATLAKVMPYGELSTDSNRKTPPAAVIDHDKSYEYLQEGNRLYAEKDVPGAIAAYRKAIEADPTFSRPYEDLAIVYWNEKNYVEAAEAQKKAVELRPDSPDVHMEYGSILNRLGKKAESEAEYKKVVDLAPENYDAWNQMAIRQYEQGKYRESEAGFREAMRLSPDNPSFIGNVGKALTKQGKWDEGEQFFLAAMKKDPEKGEPYYCLATVEMERKKYGGAEALCRTAIDKEPNEGKYHAELAGALLRQGNKEEAMAEAKKGIDLDYKSHWVYKELGLGGVIR
jgi:tetratricopeptide (TPR) repeat protein